MKRYASHFLLLPGYGYLKQSVVEMEGNRVTRIFLLSEEIENTEWLPGIIILLNKDIGNNVTLCESYFRKPYILSSIPERVEKQLSSLIPYLLFPFDFTTMQPVAETQHRLLR